MHPQQEQKNTGYANSAELSESQLDQDWYDPYYYYWGNGPWYLDSGASSHITANLEKLYHSPTSSGIEISEIKTGGGESHPVKGTGRAIVQTSNRAIKLKSVKYVPSMRKNLVSVGAIADTGHRILFSSRACWVINSQGAAIAVGHRDPSNGLYSLCQHTAALSSEHSVQNHTSLWLERSENPPHNLLSLLWHRRLGHLSYFGLYHLYRTTSVLGLPRIAIGKHVCSCCMTGQQHRECFPQKFETRSTKPDERIHSDLMGPMQQNSLGGSKYALVFTYDCSRKEWVKSKGETLTKFRDFKQRIEGETGNKIKTLRTDCGGEYLL